MNAGIIQGIPDGPSAQQLPVGAVVGFPSSAPVVVQSGGALYLRSGNVIATAAVSSALAAMSSAPQVVVTAKGPGAYGITMANYSNARAGVIAICVGDILVATNNAANAGEMAVSINGGTSWATVPTPSMPVFSASNTWAYHDAKTGYYYIGLTSNATVYRNTSPFHPLGNWTSVGAYQGNGRVGIGGCWDFVEHPAGNYFLFVSGGSYSMHSGSSDLTGNVSNGIGGTVISMASGNGISLLWVSMGTTTGQIWKASNRCATWTSIAADSDKIMHGSYYQYHTMAFCDGVFAYTGTDNAGTTGMIASSTDNGATWTKVATPVPSLTGQIHNIDGMFVWFTGGGFGSGSTIYVSSDAKNWSPVVVPVSPTAVSVYPLDGNGGNQPCSLDPVNGLSTGNGRPVFVRIMRGQVGIPRLTQRGPENGITDYMRIA